MAVLLETSVGDITIDLHYDKTPKTVTNFLALCKTKYYNNCVFHNVQKNFMIQTGDPTGSGKGGDSIWGQLFGPQARHFPAELRPDLRHRKPGTVSMANAGDKDANASQFFITCAADLDYLDDKHTVFGEVSEGMDVVQKISEQMVDGTFRPLVNIRIKHITILDDPVPDAAYPKGLAALIPDASPDLKRDDGDVRLEWGESTDEFDKSGKTDAELDAEMKRRDAQGHAVVLEMIGDLPEADVAPPDNVLFVCKLNPATRDEDLELIFGRFGEIKSCEVIRDAKTGDSLQYAFIEFATAEQSEQAYMKMDNVLIDDRRIKVDFSQSVATLWSSYRRGDKGFGGGRGGGRGGARGGGVVLKDQHVGAHNSFSEYRGPMPAAGGGRGRGGSGSDRGGRGGGGSDRGGRGGGGGGRGVLTCFKCGGTGHKSFDCPQAKGGSGSSGSSGGGGGAPRSDRDTKAPGADGPRRSRWGDAAPASGAAAGSGAGAGPSSRSGASSGSSSSSSGHSSSSGRRRSRSRSRSRERGGSSKHSSSQSSHSRDSRGSGSSSSSSRDRRRSSRSRSPRRR